MDVRMLREKIAADLEKTENPMQKYRLKGVLQACDTVLQYERLSLLSIQKAIKELEDRLEESEYIATIMDLIGRLSVYRKLQEGDIDMGRR